MRQRTDLIAVESAYHDRMQYNSVIDVVCIVPYQRNTKEVWCYSSAPFS
jgi:hypothetical protein